MELGTPVVFARKPFGGDLYKAVMPEGNTIKQIVKSVPDLPLRFEEYGEVCINGDIVPRALWHRIRPKANTDQTPVVVTLHLAPAGGLGGGKGKSGGGGKSIITTIAAIAIIAVASFVSAGGLTVLAPTLFSAGAFGAGTIGAALAAAAVSSLGLMALNALTPSPSVESETFKDRTRQDRSSFADGNIVSPGGIIPRVIGTYKIYPPLIVTPLIDLVDDNEVIEAVYALAGPHSMEDVRIDNFPADDLEELEYQVREGWTDDDDINLIERYGIVESPQIELSSHVLDEENKRKFKHTSNPTIDLPVWHGVVVPSQPDEIWLQLICPQGFYHQTTDANVIGVPYRIRIRQEGQTSWINFPEVHLRNKVQSAFRRMIRIKFVANSGEVPSAPTPPTTYGWRYAFRSVPEQTTNNPGGGPTSGGWTADSHFSSGAGIEDTANTHREVQDITFYLYGATFAGTRRWEVQIIRGCAYIAGSFSNTTYNYAGLGTNVHDLFGYKISDGTVAGTIAGDPIVPQNQDDILSTTALLRSSAVYNTLPVVRPSAEQAAGFALLVLKGRNKNFTKVSVQAGGYVPDWDGTEWANYVVTSNPAPHYRDVLVGSLNYDPLPPSIMDDDNLVEWRQTCIDFEYTCDLIAEGRSIAELLSTVAGCGRAKPRMSDLLGVMVDINRQNETPVQLFTPRNSNSFRYDIPFSKKPDGYIVSYRNQLVGYEEDQIIVYSPDSSPETADKFESVTFEGIVEEDKVVRRMEFDEAQLTYRPATYAIETDMEYLVCRRGDLIGLSHDVIHPRAGYARIKEINVVSGDVESILVDNELQLSTGTDFFGLTNVFTEPDIFLTGSEFGVAIRLTDGSIITKALSSVGLTDLLEFATPFALPSALEVDCLVTVGDIDSEYDRFIVKEIEPMPDLTARLILTAEAPEIHPFYEEDFGDHTIGAGTPVGFTNRWGATSLSYAIQAEGIAGSVSGKEFKLAFGTDERKFVSWDAVSNLYTDVEVTVGFYVVAIDASISTSHAGIIVRGGGAAASETGYRLTVISTAAPAAGGGIFLGYYLNGAATTVATAPFAWALNTRYYMKLSCIGKYIKAKIWAHNAAEPSDWLIEAENEGITDPGRVGFFATQDSSDPAFDYISVKVLEVQKS